MKCLSSSNIVKEKKCYIAGAIILSIFVIAVIVICFFIFWFKNDESNLPTDNSTDRVPPFTKALIVQIDNSDLWALDVDTNNSSFVVRHWKDRINSFDFHMRKTIYIGSPGIGKSIESSAGQYSELSQPSDWVANKVAVDHVNGKVYTLDVAASNINIFDVTNEHHNIVMSQFRGSKDIALDSVRRLLFVLLSSAIVRAEMDGSSRKTIVETTVLSSFTIDHNGTIYYADLENINSMNYTGHEHRVVAKTSHIVTSIAALEESVYWLCEFENSILYSCKLVNGSCPNVSRIPFSERLVQIKAYNFEEVHMPDPCKDRNRGCDHMCIMNSDYSSRCFCSVGWILDTDSKSCRAADDFLLYVEGNIIKTQILDASAESFIEATLAVPLNTSFFNECNFDFSVRNRMFIFSDGKRLYKKDLTPGGLQTELGYHDQVYDTEEYIIPAVDWISNNLYYVSMDKYRTPWWSVRVRTMNSDLSASDKYIFSTDNRTENITSLIAHPNRGVLFLTSTGDPDLVKISEVHLDGALSSNYGQNLSVSGDKNVLGIDYVDERLYWFDRNKQEIHYSNLNVVAVKSIDIKIIDNPMTMSIYGNWLYVSTLNNMWRLDKLTGESAMKYWPKFEEGTQRNLGAKVFSYTMQHVDKSHPCAIYNGDCEQYCFAVPSKTRTLRKVCGCREDEQLNPDGKTCHSTTL